MIEERVDRYAVFERLGEGTSGELYAAYDGRLDRRIALKLLRPVVCDGPDRERMQREARALAQLQHPNIITVHDAGPWRDRFYIAMELIHGAPLDAWSVATRRSWREVVDILIQVADGLACAHDAGLVHRRVHARNVLVGTDGRARVTDFGLAARDAEASGEIGDRRDFCAMALETIRTAPRAIARCLASGLGDTPEPSLRTLVAALRRARRMSGRRTLALAAVAGVMLVGTGLVVAARSDDASGDPCAEGAETAFAATWNPLRRAAIARTFVASELPFSAEMALRTTAALDDHAARWRDAHARTCHLARALDDTAGAITPVDLRIACLDAARRRTAALVAELEALDAASIHAAPMAVVGLDELGHCDDTDSLARAPQPPTTAAYREVAELLDRARAEAALQRSDRGLEIIARAAPRIADVNWKPLEAELRLVEGHLLQQADRPDDARRALVASVHLAEAARLPELKLRALRRLFLATYPHDQQAAERWLRLEAAVATAAGDAIDARATVALHRGLLASIRRQYPEGIARFEESLALARRGALAELELDALFNLASALAQHLELDRAAPLFEQAFARATERYGANHPQLRHYLISLAAVAELREDYVANARYAERALALSEATLPTGSVAIATAHTDLASAQHLTRNDDAAARNFETGIALLEATTAIGELVRARWSYGAFLRDRGELGRSRELLSLALDDQRRLRDPDPLTESAVLADLAATYARLGDHVRAADCLRRAIARKPGYLLEELAQHERDLATELSALGRDGEAARIARSAVSHFRAAGVPERARELARWVR